jgi:hypothetical protein
MKIDPGSRLVQGSSGHPGLPEDVAVLPSLPLEGWAATRDTLHMWAQVVGKIKLAYAPPKNHWWHLTLHLDLRGITTAVSRSMTATASRSVSTLSIIS